MSTFITAILYKKNEINEDALFNYFKHLPNNLQFTDSVAKQHFVHTVISPEVSAIFHFVNGYSSRAKCFGLQCELFQQENLLFLIKDELLQHQSELCIYSHLYCDMDGFEENTKLTEKGFEIRQVMDGEYMKIYKEDEKPTETLMLKSPAQRKKYPVDCILEELRITEKEIIDALYRIEKEGKYLV
ncbi:hypothetical protein SAMN05421780_101102 [Flexibacter flexilis DSM 6793]|uniref:Uncharacterized protein n=1 Tax=Flexibacter flexilis DSM 6793 TaxID=927664 RepID=A0A1I1DBC9_9BACT|nr:hypothetical protein [Flexibacter flexilis]SFB72265.1 hypothetical protein SAMN05421780_101102 [Flexibacter flexilis DSM 6793]